MNKHEENKKNAQGMTLVELIVYLALLSVLMEALLKTAISISGDIERRRDTAQRDLNTMIASERAHR